MMWHLLLVGVAGVLCFGLWWVLVALWLGVRPVVTAVLDSTSQQGLNRDAWYLALVAIALALALGWLAGAVRMGV